MGISGIRSISHAFLKVLVGKFMELIGVVLDMGVMILRKMVMATVMGPITVTEMAMAILAMVMVGTATVAVAMVVENDK
jgi:uncharacterized membrane protein